MASSDDKVLTIRASHMPVDSIPGEVLTEKSDKRRMEIMSDTPMPAAAASSIDAIAADLWKAADACGFEQFRETVRAAIAAGGAQEAVAWKVDGLNGYNESAPSVWLKRDNAEAAAARLFKSSITPLAEPLPRVAATVLTDEQMMAAIKSVCGFDAEKAEQWRPEALAIGRAVERALLAASTSANVAQGAVAPDGRVVDKAMVKRLAVQYGLLPEQTADVAQGAEAVAWLVTSKRGLVRVAWTDKPTAEQIAISEYDGDTITPLYTAPPAQHKSDWHPDFVTALYDNADPDKRYTMDQMREYADAFHRSRVDAALAAAQSARETRND